MKNPSLLRLFAVPSIVSRPARGAAIFVCLTVGVQGQSIRPSGSDASAPEEWGVVELDPVRVTGSNISRLEVERAVPITVLDSDAIEVRGAILPVDLLASLPSVVNLPENETRLGSSGARGDNANINLRNLGATGTLILVNGRRMAINPMTAGLSQAVNVNHLPTHGIERVEVLRDGASAIYGSDAVGGVVNYVLKRDFSGSETNLRFGVPEAGGGQSLHAAYTFGSSFAEGRGRLFGTVEALYKDAIYLSDREFSSTANNTHRVPEPFNRLGGPFDARTPRGLYPTFRVGTTTTNSYFRPVDGALALTTVAPTRGDSPEFFLDLNQFGMASPRMRRANSFLSGEFDLSDTLTAFADVSYYKARSTMARQPLALNAPTSDRLKVMPVDNPFNPYGANFYHPAGEPTADGRQRLVGEPSEISLVSLTLPGLGAERIETESDVIRLNAGLKGEIGESWTWEAAGFYNKVEGLDEAYPDVRESLLERALLRTDAGAYNPFGYTFKVENGAVVPDQAYVNSQEIVDSFADVFARTAESYIASFDARASGRLFTLWDNEVMGAFGGEYRREDLKDMRPPFSGGNPPESGLNPLDNDFLLHPPRPDVFGDRSVTSFYAEIAAPLVAEDRDLPLVESLELTASARYESYSDFGDTTKPKVGLNWSPVSWMMLRASYNEGFMAPSLAALFTSPRWTNSAGAGEIDTYRNPVTNEGPYVQRTYFGGNPELAASESEGKTYGVVFDVPGIDGLTVTVDHWNIQRSNLLGQRSVAQIRASDTALLQAYTRQQIQAGVPIDEIDLGSGTANYQGDPAVERLALTPEDRAAFAAFNAANPTGAQAAAGRIFSVNRPFINLSSSEHEGIDIGLRYALPERSFGRVSFYSDWAYLSKSRSTVEAANVDPIENDDRGVNGAARWRGTTTATWNKGLWSASLGAYYVGESQDSGATTTEAIYESLGRPSYIAKHTTGGRDVYRYVMDSTLSFNLSLGYRFRDDASALMKGTRLRLGVLNALDEEPPVSSGGFGYSPSVSQSLLAGRTWTFELSKSF